MSDPIAIGRKDAARLIDRLRSHLANRTPHEAIEAELAHEQGLIDGPAIPRLTPCPGSAHDDAYVDHCMVCAPRWGLVGPRVVVR